MSSAGNLPELTIMGGEDCAGRDVGRKVRKVSVVRHGPGLRMAPSSILGMASGNERVDAPEEA
jgi:hypothetical protein